VGPTPNLTAPGGAPEPPEAPPAEIARRLFEWMTFSTLVGIPGGVVIARVVSAPIDDLVRATQRIGQGDLDVRVRPRGSQEMLDLARNFNHMAADLQQAETLRNNLMADVSHELRTPLTVLEGNLRAALDHVYALSKTEVPNLYSQTRHLIRLVNDLRELALAEAHALPLEKQPAQLNELVLETVQALEPLAAEKKVRLSDQTPTFPAIVVDAGRLRQVLFNLLFNALRHTPAGGGVLITGRLNPGEICLTVKDTGEGLGPDQLLAVFDRFYRGDKSRSRDTGGTGLGLAIVKAIVEAHGGRVEAQSAGKGQGSQFSIHLPVG
jgi:signal transduction histidine kinase